MMESIDRGSLDTGELDRFQAGHVDFMRARREGLRGEWIAVTPDGRHLDAVDFQAEVDARHAAGLEGYGFWTTPLNEVDNQELNL